MNRSPEAGSAAAVASPPERSGAFTARRTRFEAEYELESPARCGSCETILSCVGVVRLMRTSVNFTSTLPHRGFLIVCPHCHSILPAALYEVAV